MDFAKFSKLVLGSTAENDDDDNDDDSLAAARKLFGKEPEKESLVSQNGIGGQKKEVTVEHKTAGTLVAAKRSTMCSQSFVTLGCMAGTVLTSTVLMHIFGAIAGGSLESGDGDIMVLPWCFAARMGIFMMMMAWVNVRSTEVVLGDAASGPVGTVIQMVWGGVTFFIT